MIQLLRTSLGLIFILMTCFITWQNLSLQQQHWLMDQLGIHFERTLPAHLPLVAPIIRSPLRNANETKSTLINNDIKKETKIFTHTFEEHALSRLCLKTKTRSINEVEKTSIYRWTDKNGQVHFSDSQPKKKSSVEVTERYASKKQYFRMQLQSPEHGLPTLLGEQLQRDVNAIYGYLSDRMEQKHLRQVDLNLKVFNTSAGFEHYRQKHAPSLKSIAGFYTAINNEAVVMQQHNDKQTRSIARHEATHVINAGLFGHSPIWFNEGLAEYFEGYTYAELKNNITPVKRYYLRHLSSLMNSQQLLSLTEYLQLSGAEWRARDPKTMYGMAWSIIYLLQGHQEGEQLTNRLMAKMAENPCFTVDAVSFWQKNYPGGLAAFESRWRVMLLSN